MQKAISLEHKGFVLRGMEHVPIGAEQRPAAILFHGFTANKLQHHRMFLKLSRALEQENIINFRFDFSGSGESDGDFENVTLSGEIEEAHAILDMVRRDKRVDASRICLIGLSLGGVVASIVAADRPQDVHKLVLLAPAGNIRDSALQVARSANLDENASLFDLQGDLIGRSFAADLMQYDFFARAKAFTGDVTLIHGTNDMQVPYQVSTQYHEQAYQSRARVEFIEGADHTFNKFEWEQSAIRMVVEALR